eukprot:CCRYP_017074-RA/>CCRYP_017074-RA protein AED:0.38 eAED:1.00 QI:0/-1/0/1/-1/0/1/0/140
MSSSSLRMRSLCTPTYVQAPHWHTSPTSFARRPDVPSTTTTHKHSSKPPSLSSQTTSSNLGTHIGNKSPEQAWALPPPPHGPPFITPFTKTGSFHVGPQMSSCTAGSSTTLSASGYVTPALNTTTPSGHSSKRTCNNGTD